jgi:hypothetical protein
MRSLAPIALTTLLAGACAVESKPLGFDPDQPLYDGDGPPEAGDGADGGGPDGPSDSTTTTSGGSAGDLPPGSPVTGTFVIDSDFGLLSEWSFVGETVECSGCVWAFEAEFSGSSEMYLGFLFRDGGGDLDWRTYLTYYGTEYYWSPGWGDGAGTATWERGSTDDYYGYYSYTYTGVASY